MKKIECLYCGKIILSPDQDSSLISQYQSSPGVENVDWKRESKKHYPDCEWVKTHSHTILENQEGGE